MAEPLAGCSYLQLPQKLRNSKKSLINIQNKDKKGFLWCHVRHKNPKVQNPRRGEKPRKEVAASLNYEDINFLVSKKDYNKSE